MNLLRATSASGPPEGQLRLSSQRAAIMMPKPAAAAARLSGRPLRSALGSPSPSPVAQKSVFKGENRGNQ